MLLDTNVSEDLAASIYTASQPRRSRLVPHHGVLIYAEVVAVSIVLLSFTPLISQVIMDWSGSNIWALVVTYMEKR
jgi:hypothetical protein